MHKKTLRTRKSNLKKNILIIALIMFFVVPSFGKAATQDEIRAQIQALLQQIHSLQAQVNAQHNPSQTVSVPPQVVPGGGGGSGSGGGGIQVGGGGGSAGGGGQSVANFDHDLYFGLKNDPDISSLQELLTDQGYYAGPISGNYFLLTFQAVKKFQSSNGIRPSGYFGSKTRALANQIVQKLVSSVCSEEGCPNDVLPSKALQISTQSDLHATVGQYFAATFRVSGGSGNYAIDNSGSRTFPSELSFTRTYCPSYPTEVACAQVISPDTITLYGTPRAGGVYDFGILAKDTNGGYGYGKERFTLIIKGEESSLQPPVIQGIKGPTALKAGEEGLWTVNAYDPGNGSLSYAVVWGDEVAYATRAQEKTAAPQMAPFVQAATFSHTYRNPGTYTPVFRVVNSSGQEAKTSISVAVGGSTNSAPMFSVSVSETPLYYLNSNSIPSPARPYKQTTLVRGKMYHFAGQVSNGAPNARVYLYLQRPDGSLKFDNANDILAKNPYTDSNGQWNMEADQMIDAQGQNGAWTVWMTVGGVRTNNVYFTVGDATNPSMGSLQIDPSSATIKVGDSIRVRAMFTDPVPSCAYSGPVRCLPPTRAPYEVNASFVSDNPQIAAVPMVPLPQSGYQYQLRGISTGSAIITATYTNTNDRSTFTAKMGVMVTSISSISCTGLEMVWDTIGTIGRRDPYSYQTDSCDGYRHVVNNAVSPSCYSKDQCLMISGGTCVNVAEAKAACGLSLTLLSPNGGEIWQLKNTHRITYSPDLDQSRLTATLEQLVNGQFVSVGKIIPTAKGSIYWDGDINSYGSYPQPGSYYVHLVDNQTGAEDRSNAAFTIVAADTVKADLKVNGSDGPISGLSPGTQYTVSWTSTNADTCQLYYPSASDGVQQGLTNLPSSGTQTLTAPNNSTDYFSLQCKSSRIEGYGYDQVQLKPISSTSTNPSITVVSPNGGEVLQQGQTYQVNWNLVNFNSEVAINLIDYTPGTRYGMQYGITNGISIRTVPGQTSFSWVIPSSIPAGNYYKVVIGWGSVNDFSNDYFAIGSSTSPTPTITSTSAKAAGNFEMDAGGSASISGNYLAGNYLSTTKVFIGGIQATVTYASDNLLNITVPSSLTAGQSYDLYVSNEKGTSNVVRVKILSNVNAQPSITIIYPQAGYSLYNGLGKGDGAPATNPIATITWTSSNVGSFPIEIDLLNTSGSIVKTIATGLQNTGSYRWLYDSTIPSGKYMVSVSSQVKEGTPGSGAGRSGIFSIVSDSSSPSTSTQPSITVLSPNGGETFYTGQAMPFSWQWSGSSAPLQPIIYLYSVASGQTIYGTFSSSNISYRSNTDKQVGSFDALLNYPSVSIPGFVSGGQYKFKVCEYPEGTNNSAYPSRAPVCDFSDAPFSIVSSTFSDQSKLIVSLDSSKPIATNLPAGSTQQTIGAFKFSAPTQSQITFMSFALVDYVNANPAVSADLKNFSLWDGTTQIGQTVPLTITPPSGTTPGSMNFYNLRFIVPAGSSKVLIVKADVSLTAAGNRHAIQLAGFSYAESIGNNWAQNGPFTGPSFSIAPVVSTQPSITVLSPNGGERLTMGSTYTIRWNSSMANLDADFSLVDARTLNTFPIYYTTAVTAGEIPNAWIVGNLANGSKASAGSYYIRACQRGTQNCAQSAAPFSIVSGSTSSVGALRVALDSGTAPAGQVVMGSVGNSLATFLFTETSNVEAMKITDLNVFDQVAAASGASAVKAAFTNLHLFQGSTDLGAAGTAQISQGPTAGYFYSFHFSNPVTVPQASTISLVLKGDVSSYASSGSTDNTAHIFKIEASADPANKAGNFVRALGLSSNALATVTTSTAVGTPQTVLRTKLTVSATPLGALTSRVSLPNDDVATINFTADSAGSLTINAVTITFRGSAQGGNFYNISSANVQLYDPNNGISYFPTASSPTAGTVTFSLNGGYTLGPGTTKSFALRVNSIIAVSFAPLHVSPTLAASIASAGDVVWTDGLDTAAVSGLNLPASAVPINIASVSFAAGTGGGGGGDSVLSPVRAAPSQISLAPNTPAILVSNFNVTVPAAAGANITGITVKTSNDIISGRLPLANLRVYVLNKKTTGANYFGRMQSEVAPGTTYTFNDSLSLDPFSVPANVDLGIEAFADVGSAVSGTYTAPISITGISGNTASFSGAAPGQDIAVRGSTAFSAPVTSSNGNFASVLDAMRSVLLLLREKANSLR